MSWDEGVMAFGGVLEDVASRWLSKSLFAFVNDTESKYQPMLVSRDNELDCVLSFSL